MQQWLGYQLEPSNYGWTEEGGCFTPNPGVNNVCPKSILKIIHCSCSKGCVHQSCGCRQLNITCTDNCNCGKSDVPCKNVHKELVPISDDNEIEIEEDIGNDIETENENINLRDAASALYHESESDSD